MPLQNDLKNAGVWVLIWFSVCVHGSTAIIGRVQYEKCLYSYGTPASIPSHASPPTLGHYLITPHTYLIHYICSVPLGLTVESSKTAKFATVEYLRITLKKCHPQVNSSDTIGHYLNISHKALMIQKMQIV